MCCVCFFIIVIGHVPFITVIVDGKNIGHYFFCDIGIQIQYKYIKNMICSYNFCKWGIVAQYNYRVLKLVSYEIHAAVLGSKNN